MSIWSRAIVLALALALFPRPDWAPGRAVLAAAKAPGAAQVQTPRRLGLTLGKSIILNTEADIGRISVAQPEVADFVLLSPRQLYLAGKGVGVTNLTLWTGENKVLGVYDLDVTPDVSRLKKLLHDLLPNEPGIEITTANESLALAGTAKSPEAMARAMSLAEAYAPGKVLNLMQVAGVHQVQLEVRVAEMSKTVVKRLGINPVYQHGGDLFQSFFKNLTFLDSQGRLVLSSNVAAQFAITNGATTWSGFLDALKEDGLVKVLAEPTLMCLSGQSADFLAGGEIPIPVPQGFGAVAIEFKQFGVGLKFTPTVLGAEKINLQVAPEVSDLDFSRAITIQNIQIPAISTRRAKTNVELADGQTFAIAGLLRDDARETASRFPIVGDVPVLGQLFRSSQFQKDGTELVIMVTPRLVKPLDNAGQPLPTDGYREPDDLEFYVTGLRHYGAPSRWNPAPVDGSPPAASSGLDGQFGHILPQGR